MTIDDMIDLIDRTTTIMRDVRSLFEPRMNVLDIAGLSHLELKNSDIIAFLLSPRAEHKSTRIGELFLERIGRDLGGSLKGRAVRWVRREQSTNEARRIDILIETDMGEHIIIENKVGADDSSDQLKDYISWVHETYNAAPLTLYLSPSGEAPSEASLPLAEREGLERSRRFICISYAEHIVAWLDDALREPSVSEYDLLRSALLQYKDAIEGFCGIRKDNNMEQGAIVSDLIKRYGSDRIAAMDIGTLQDASTAIQRAVDHLAILHFLSDIRARLIELGHARVAFTIGQERYFDEERWVHDSLDDPSGLGVELVMEIGESERFGVGLEFAEATRNASIYFGIMAHGNGLKAKLPSVALPQRLLEDIGNYSTDACEWWWQYAIPGSWFNQALFRFGNCSAWQDENQSLSRHVVNNWIAQLSTR